MRRKYKDCQGPNGNCAICSLVNYGRDCHNNPITNFEWQRLLAEMTQKQLSDASGVNIRQIQKVESGEIDAGNMSARNLLSIANALDVAPELLI